eukprot:2599032-Pyramimonas_sp.AAC.1
MTPDHLRDVVVVDPIVAAVAGALFLATSKPGPVEAPLDHGSRWRRGALLKGSGDGRDHLISGFVAVSVLDPLTLVHAAIASSPAGPRIQFAAARASCSQALASRSRPL